MAKAQLLNITKKVDHLLEEIRVVLPGTQALLGFQLAAIFADGFSKLSPFVQIIHFFSLLCVAITTVLLLAPAAYDRLVEKDHDTEHFHVLASRMLLLAMVFLSIGLSIDFFVISFKIFKTLSTGIVFALFVFLLSFSLWFVYGGYHRLQHR